MENLLSTLLSSSESSDDEIEDLLSQIGHCDCDDHNHLVKVKNFTNIIMGFSDNEFKKHLRVNKETFNVLVLRFENSIFYAELNSHGGSSAKSPALHISAFLWFAGNKTTFRVVALLFDTSISTMHEIINRVIKFIWSIGKTVIKFPCSIEEKQEISTAFQYISGFPNIVGCIDGTHINIRTPANKIKSTYVDRHHQTAIVLQAICDSRRRFLDVFTGLSGKVHDARVYKLSFVRQKIENLEPIYHILGDSAYPLSPNLLTPYRQYGNLTEEQKPFNLKFSQSRVKIENAFGLLKGRFRHLLHVDFFKVEKLSEFVIACCLLHNLCIDNNDFVEEAENEDSDDEDEDEEENQLNERDRILRRLGEIKRDGIKELFNH